MIHAELKNKCGDWRESEDALTSTVFGYLKYNLFRSELKAFFESAANWRCRKRFTAPDWLSTVTAADFKFWNRHFDNKEPDLEIASPCGKSLGVEVKYGSNEQEGQLGNYLAGNDELIYITMDSTLDSALEPITKYSLKQQEKIYWLSWHQLHRVIAERLRNPPTGNVELSSTKTEMLKDLQAYLEKRGIQSFQGFREAFQAPRITSPLFWKQTLFANVSIPVTKRVAPIFFTKEKQ